MKKEVLSKQIRVRTTPKVKKSLKSEAKRKGLTISQIVNDAIKNRGKSRKYVQVANLPSETELSEIESEVKEPSQTLNQSDRDFLHKLGLRKNPTFTNLINLIRENPEKVLETNEKYEKLLLSVESLKRTEKELEKVNEALSGEFQKLAFPQKILERFSNVNLKEYCECRYFGGYIENSNYIKCLSHDDYSERILKREHCRACEL